MQYTNRENEQNSQVQRLFSQMYEAHVALCTSKITMTLRRGREVAESQDCRQNDGPTQNQSAYSS